MNAALIRKTLRDSRTLLLLILLAILVFELVIVFVIRQSAAQLLNVLKTLPFVMRFVQTLLGAEGELDATPTALITIGFSHPFLFAVTWGYIIASCTRVTVAEFDRGTADLLLTLPISRRAVYVSTSSVCLLAGIPICILPWVGIWIATHVVPLEEPPNYARLGLLLVNLYALYVAIAGVSLLVSTMNSRYGVAVLTIVGILLASFIFNFLVALVPSLGWISWAGLLTYYRPMDVVRSGGLNWAHIATLLGVGLAAWLAGMRVFTRRDIPAA